MKLYLPQMSQNLTVNKIVLLNSALGIFAIIIVSDILGLRIEALSHQMLRCCTFVNPFIILISIALFNMFLYKNIRCVLISKISSVSLMVYMIHENLLFRRYVKPEFWFYIYNKFTYENLIVWILLFAVFCIITSVVIALLYNVALKKPIVKVCDLFNNAIKNTFGKLIDKLLLIK